MRKHYVIFGLFFGLINAAWSGSKPERIVSMVPSNTEILFAIGAGDQVIGISKWCNYPEAAQKITRIGDMSPNLEQLMAIHPDLVIADISQKVYAPDLARLNIKAEYYPATSARNLQDVYDIIDGIGHRVRAKRQAHELIHQMKAKASEIVKRSHVVHKPRVYIELWPDPLLSAGKNTLLNDLIISAGGENITGDRLETAPRISPEFIMASDPEIIIVLDKAGVEAIPKRPGWSNIRAVRKQRIVWVDSDIVSRAGPRIIDGLKELAAALHPDIFK